MILVKRDRTENREGVTITYEVVDTDYLIQSRKRAIPHANRRGNWWYTSFFVLRRGEELGEANTLKGAVRLVQGLLDRGDK